MKTDYVRKEYNQTSAKYLVNVAHFPEEDKEFLVELNALGRPWQICLGQWVVQQACDAFQDECKILNVK
jgi:hypothetical protein